MHSTENKYQVRNTFDQTSKNKNDHTVLIKLALGTNECHNLWEQHTNLQERTTAFNAKPIPRHHTTAYNRSRLDILGQISLQLSPVLEKCILELYFHSTFRLGVNPSVLDSTKFIFDSGQEPIFLLGVIISFAKQQSTCVLSNH